LALALLLASVLPLRLARERILAPRR